MISRRAADARAGLGAGMDFVDDRWAELFDSGSSAQTRDHYVLQRLQTQLEYVRRRSPFYQSKLQGHPGVLASLGAFAQLPVTTKAELREDARTHPPYGSNLCIAPSEIARTQGTSGSTGAPHLLCFSAADWDLASRQTAALCARAGVTGADRFFLTMPLHLFVGGWGMLGAAERLGCGVITAGGLRIEHQLELLARTAPTVLVSTPSYALFLLDRAREAGADLAAGRLRIGIFGGEPGIAIPAYRRRIEDGYGLRAVDFGNTAEMHPCSNMSCRCGSEMHLYDNVVYCEVVDPDDPTRLVAPGEEGVLVYTHLQREGMPMVRFWSGDLAVYTDEICACGAAFRRLVNGVRGRTDDLVNHRGVKFYPGDISQAVAAVPGLTGAFALVEGPQISTYRLYAEAQSMAEAAALKLALEAAVARKLLCRLSAAIAPAGSLPRPGLKEHRVWRLGEEFRIETAAAISAAVMVTSPPIGLRRTVPDHGR